MGFFLDFNYLYACLIYRPCDFGISYTDNGQQYVLADKEAQREHMGAGAAGNCPYFHNNDELAGLAKDRPDKSKPFVMILENGKFTGVYTYDENEEYPSSGGATTMYVFFILPICVAVLFFWLILSHNKVTCFNRKAVAKFLSDKAAAATPGKMKDRLSKLRGTVMGGARGVADRGRRALCCCCNPHSRSLTGLLRRKKAQRDLEGAPGVGDS